MINIEWWWEVKMGRGRTLEAGKLGLVQTKSRAGLNLGSGSADGRKTTRSAVS